MERSTARAVKTNVKLVSSLCEVRASDIVMALRSVISSKIPMVIILGATGTGKTKLGIELAQRYGSEIISADSMQIYKGLDIVTAKASPGEQELIKHHLLDILEPHQMFTVVDFRNRALRIIENLINQGKVPIIVGGTNYYIESIVYNILVENMSDTDALLWDRSRRKRDLDDDIEEKAKRFAPDTKDGADDGLSPKRDINNIDITKLKEDIDEETKLTNDEIHERLKAIDPIMASRLHPNNRRKILRSIEVWLKTGRRHSDVLEEQKTSEGKLRRPEGTVILWLKCDQEVHDQRLNDRVESMIEGGLINELLDFHDRHNRQRIKDGRLPDYTKGIFQTLGLKEFHEFLMLSVEEKNSEEGKKLLKESIDNMKMGTRRYARRQNKMVKGRFLEHPNREIPLIYELDTTDLTKWDEVKNKAILIINSLINNSSCEYSPSKGNTPENFKTLDRHSSNYCEVCERLIIGDKEYSIHLNSNKHKKVMKLKKKLAITTQKEETVNK